MKERKNPKLIVSDNMKMKVPRAELRDAVGRGASLNDLAKAFYVSKDNIRGLLREYGLSTNFSIRNERREMKEVDIRKLKAMIKEGHGIAYISDMLDRTEARIRKAMDKHGLKTNADVAKETRGDRDERILSMLREGCSNAQIVAKMKGEGITKGVVSGVRHRAKLAGNVLPGEHERGKAPKVLLRPKRPEVKANSTPHTEPVVVKIDRKFDDPIQFEELNSGTCRYPIGTRPPYMFCGKPVRGELQPYCADCAKYCFEPQEVKARLNRKTGLRRGSWDAVARRFG